MTNAARGIPRRSSAEAIPLSFAQQRLWFLDQLTPGSALYNIPVAARLSAQLDVSAVQRSVDEIVRRHEILRTRFPAVGGEPVQEIVPHVAVPLALVDLRALPASEREEEASRVAADAAMRPFDLAVGPLVRALLIRIEDAETVFVFTVHHIVFDEWSLGIFMRELAVLYDAYAHARPSPLREPAIQYADFAVWQRAWLQGEVLQTQLDYWQRQLRDLPALQLPTDLLRPPTPSHRGRTHALVVPAELTRGLRALGRQRGCTLFMTLLAAWKALLARYSGQDDFAVGVPIAYRNRPAIEDVIGFFVNTLVLRTDLSGDPPFAEILERVRDVALGAYAHQDLPFVTLVERLQPQRTISHNPLFQVIFQLIGAPSAEPAEWRTRLSSMQVQRETAIFDLTFGLEDHGETLRGGIVYSADLFAAPTIARMAEHFLTLLGGIVADPSARLSRLPLLTGAAREQLVAAGAARAADGGKASCVHRQVEAQVRRTPAATAVVFGGDALTYDELNRRANRLARRLRALGAGPDAAVAVAIERSVEMIVAWYAVLKAGSAYVPLDLAHPRERILHVLEQTAPVAVVVLARDAERIADAAVRVVPIDAGAPDAAGEDDDDLGDLVSPDHLAYILFTSGSTGVPKAIAIPHRAITRLVSADYVALRSADRVAQLSTSTFDAATFEIWQTLTHGATVVGIPRDVVLEPHELAARLRAERIGTLFLTTALFNEVARQAPDAFAAADQVLFGGENADPSCVAEVLQRGAPRRLMHVYGPTENTTFSTVCVVRDVAPRAASVPIGEPLRGTSAFVLDRHLEPSPVGVPGELYLGGDGLARGYLGRPDATAARFVPNPFSAQPGARLYRTGDRARVLSGGGIEFLGRLDRQVKLRGFRIEPGEIEAVLLRHPAVREAVVSVRDDGPRGRSIVAYVVPSTADVPQASELRRALGDVLPEYMIPAAFVVLEALPLSPTGKVDRDALPAAHPVAVTARNDAPRSATEEQLAAIWAAALNLEHVGIYDNFFELGGHSLLATQVVSRVRSHFETELPLSTLFESPTVAGFAGRLEGFRRSPPGAPEPPLASSDRGADAPASSAQYRLWMTDQLAPGSVDYTIPHMFRIEGPLDAQALERGIRTILRRHEVLRTALVVERGVLIQRVVADENVRWSMDVNDLRDAAGDEQEAEIDRLAAITQRPFELSVAPLLRARLVRLADHVSVLIITMHHVVCDGWSEGVFFGELAALYDAFARGDDDPLPPLALQYADYSIWEARRASGDEIRTQLAYWERKLAKLPIPLELSADRPRPAAPSGRGSSRGTVVRRDLADAVRALGRREGCTPFMTLLAAFVVLLQRLTGHEDVVVGAPFANRRPTETEQMIGFFVNMLVLRTDLAGDPSFIDVLARVRTTTLEAYANDGVPFERLVEMLQPQRDSGRAPLFQIVFALHNAGGPLLVLGGLTVAELDVKTKSAKFDLTVSFAEHADGLVGTIEYSTDLFEDATIGGLLDCYDVLLEAVVADPARRISQLPLLRPEQRALLVAVDGGAEPDARSAATIDALFAAQAARTPDAIAVDGASSLTYRELARRAGALARRLRVAGVGPEVRVGVFLERSAEAVVAMLAVLRAGGAYVPLDPGDPAERIRLLLDDTQVTVIVTRAELVARLPAHAARVVVPRAGDDAADGDAGGPAAGTLPDNVAYVMYTSGSTGQPKGVAVTHRGVVRVATDRGVAAITPGDAVLQFAPYTFDASTFELWGALLNGARLVVMPPQLPSLDELGAALREHRITTLWLTAELFHNMVDERLDDFAGLACMLAGGDVLSASHVRRFVARHPRCRLVNGYGPTENTTFTTCYDVRDPHAFGATVPIGRPIARTRVYVLDDALEPVPHGVAGMLYAAGDGLARGYWNRPDLTAEQWVPHPFGAPGERLYRTGDIVRRRADGDLEFIGRRDRQVKIRGHRVEPNEVEAVLAAHPAVRQAAVLAVPDAGGGRRLIAYVVPRAGTDTTASELLAALRGSVAEYLVPSAVVVLESFPLGANGKVDHAALRATGAVPRAEQPRAFRGALEEVVAAVWTDVFGLPSVGADDDFFELGGHSLAAMQVVSRLRGALGVEVDLRTLFEARTVARFASDIAGKLGRAEPPDAAPIVRVARDRAWPLAPRQAAQWELDRLIPGTPFFTIAAALRLRGELDEPALRRALDELVRRHESLRTTFALDGGRAVQIVAPSACAELRVVDLRAAPAGERDARASRHAADEALRPFDLARGPLARGLLLQLDERDHALVVTLHHIVADGWSMNVLARELTALYAAYAAGIPSPLPEPALQYVDYGQWERERIDSGAHAPALAYWTRRLAGDLSRLELPVDRPRTEQPTIATARARFAVSRRVTQELRALGSREGVTPFMTLLAAYVALLHGLTGRSDIRVGAPIANRGRRETETIVGLFANTVVLRAQLTAGMTFRELLRLVREIVLDAEEHQNVPFDQVLRALESERELDRGALFETMFLYQDEAPPAFAGSALDIGGLAFDSAALPAGVVLTTADLVLQMADGARLSGSLLYKTDLFDARTARRMVRTYRALVERCVADPGAPVALWSQRAATLAHD